jgi:two-component system response regulator QseB
MSRILLIEDDALLGDGVKSALEDEGHAVDWVRDGRHGREALAVERFSAVVLDLTLPRLDGLALLRELRGRKDATPVLILTARDTVAARVAGLDAGADDYLVKPFELAELKARLRALVRRAAGVPSNQIAYRGVEMDLGRRSVRCRGRDVTLSTREYALLAAMLSQPGRTFTRSQLEQEIYPWEREVGSNALEVHVHHLRAKLFPELIRTVRGVGYLIEPANE